MAADVTCQCNAVHMMARMATLINNWFDDMNRWEPAVGKLANEMNEHLRQQLEKPENAQVVDKNKERLDKIEKDIGEANIGARKNMGAMDTIRDTIHRFPDIRAAFLCEEPRSDKESSKLSQQVFDAMHILAEGDEPLDARKLLDQIEKDLNCP